MQGHHHHPTTENFLVEVFPVPGQVRAGEPVKLILTPTRQDTKELVVLEKVHEQYMHLLMISDDLTYFRHEHPQQAGSHFEHTHTFPYGGKYLLFIDFAPVGSSQQLSRHEFKVEGKPHERLPLLRQATWQEQDYQLYMPEYQLPLVSGTMLELSLIAKKAGEPISDLEDYLGALAHVVIISENTEEYLHVHPLESRAHGPEIKLHTLFPHAGIYKMFVQFSHLGKVRTASFVLSVS